MVDLNSKPHSITHIQNMSYDEDNQLAVREIVGVDPNGVVRKVPVTTDGALAVSTDVSLPTAGNNPSSLLSFNAAGEVVYADDIISGVTYRTTFTRSDMTVTSTLAISAAVQL